MPSTTVAEQQCERKHVCHTWVNDW